LHRVLDKRLAEVEYLAGEEYSMADIINFPWIRNPDRRNVDLADYPNVKRWHDAVAARPAVQRGVEVLSDKKKLGPMTEEDGKSRSGRQNSWRVGHLQWKWRTRIPYCSVWVHDFPWRFGRGNLLLAPELGRSPVRCDGTRRTPQLRGLCRPAFAARGWLTQHETAIFWPN
jgi:hypothetical protein